MKRQKMCITLCWTGTLAMLLVIGPLAGGSRADTTLWNNQQITLNSYYAGNVTLYDYSSATIVTNGYCNVLDAYDFSTVNAYGGNASALESLGYATVNVYGFIGYPTATHVEAAHHGTVNIYGGIFGSVYADEYGSVYISGGSVGQLSQTSYATITLVAQNIQTGTGLTFDGKNVTGEGQLSGQWLDGTPWTTSVINNWDNGNITVVPEPATTSLLGLGLLGLLRWRKRGVPHEGSN